MGRPKISEARDTRRELLDAALDLFAEHGFHGTGLRDIARAVGVREAAIYHYFPSKEALFEALITEPPEDAADGVTAILEKPIPGHLQETFEALCIGMLERVSRLRERKKFRIFLSDGTRLALEGKISVIDRMGGAARAELTKFMKRLVDQRRLSGHPEMLTISLMAPMMMWRQMLSLQPNHHYVNDFRAFARAHVAIFLQGAQVPLNPDAELIARSNTRSTRRPRK